MIDDVRLQCTFISIDLNDRVVSLLNSYLSKQPKSKLRPRLDVDDFPHVLLRSMTMVLLLH
jgi:hypothetical protein